MIKQELVDKIQNKPVPYQEVNQYIGRAATFYKCPKCGAELLYMNNSKFCGECGLELDWSDIVQKIFQKS